jgi:hypothetical protein
LDKIPAILAVQPQQTPDVFGVASINHLSGKLSLIPDAESKCASLGLGKSFRGELPLAFIVIVYAGPSVPIMSETTASWFITVEGKEVARWRMQGCWEQKRGW